MTDDAIPEAIPGEVIELAAHRRQAAPVVRDPVLSHRANATINRAAEAFAARLSVNGYMVPPGYSVSPMEGTGRVSVAIIATIDVEAFNAACEDPLLAGLDDEWRDVENIAARLGMERSVVKERLGKMFRNGEVERRGGLWRRRT